jgi:hypothetical protein
MLDTLRTFLHRAISTERGDGYRPIRWPKEIARGVNEALGEPICSREELEKRRAAERRLAELRTGPPAAPDLHIEYARAHNVESRLGGKWQSAGPYWSMIWLIARS